MRLNHNQIKIRDLAIDLPGDSFRTINEGSISDAVFTPSGEILFITNFAEVNFVRRINPITKIEKAYSPTKGASVLQRLAASLNERHIAYAVSPVPDYSCPFPSPEPPFLFNLNIFDTETGENVHASEDGESDLFNQHRPNFSPVWLDATRLVYRAKGSIWIYDLKSDESHLLVERAKLPKRGNCIGFAGR